jgi:hypothetical protein
MTSLEDWIKYGDELRRPLLVNPKLGECDSVVIVGGGLSGMCCAYRIATKRPNLKVTLIERSSKLGGVIATWQDGEWICDLAVNAARPHPAFWRLVDDLSLSDKFTTSSQKAKSRWILSAGRTHKLSWRTLFKLGPLKLRKSLKQARQGGASVAQLIPNQPIADALCLGIVNDTADNVDADFLMPSLTKFGNEPPLKKSKLRKLIAQSYPIFIPRRGSIASIEGGMQVIIDVLAKELSSLDNVTIEYNQPAKSPESVAQQYGVPIESVVWAAPGLQESYAESQLSIFAVGYKNETVSQAKIGYGTLIPDNNIPISGILNESDIHQSKRSPAGHRLFRLMVPHSRWDGDDQSVLDCAESLLGKKPVLFAKIGERSIPRYPPGYMSRLGQIKHDCSYVGWSVSGVSITHVVTEAERIAELF